MPVLQDVNIVVSKVQPGFAKAQSLKTMQLNYALKSTNMKVLGNC